MNQARTIEQLEQALRTGRREALSEPVLESIKSRGRAVRRRRWAAYAGAGVAATVLTAVVLGAMNGPGSGASEQAPATEPDTPRELSPLAERALAEIPGAVQVSDWQVVIPGPAGGPRGVMSQAVPDEYIEAGPVDIGARHYTGVTAYHRGDFPAWLYAGVQDIEKNELGDQNSHPVGSTDTGILVDAGPLELGCMRPLPEWDNEDLGDGCIPAMLGLVDGTRTFEWTMGADGFLALGRDLQLFSVEDFSAGAQRTVWIGGTDGTDVASVDLVAADGTVVEATVASGTLVPGETMFWGTVAGGLAVAVTRDADGEVLERHEVKPCSDPVDCEVR